MILGNDDSKTSEADLIRWMEKEKIWEYIHGRAVDFGPYSVYGYAYVPPTPFLNKDWERYDISRFVDPGCIPPEEGWHSVKEPKNLIEYATIQKDLVDLTQGKTCQSRFFYSIPHLTRQLWIGLRWMGKFIDHVPLDVHVGSIAVKDFILERQPLMTLHGHVHESARITGSWIEQLGQTMAISAAHDGGELALVRFDPDEPAKNNPGSDLIPD